MSDRHDGDTGQVAKAWRKVTGWLAEHAPLSHASLLPPATEEEIAAADSCLRQYVGHGLPTELVALWRLCGGVEHLGIEADEEGEVGSGRFLPGGVLYTPAQAVGGRLPLTGERDHWRGAQVVPWLTTDEAGPENGEYVGAEGVGHWSLPEMELRLHQTSLAAYLEAVHRTLTEGPADLMGPDVPGVVWGCLIWDAPAYPLLDEALPHWTPVHGTHVHGTPVHGAPR
ncbi:SMI1/KNR4 family protein [Streptomyces chilikensis]|uniref:SMI1/KNR4 family protein n=1 Tax=Streptomyces chilikensis TaxID=1194079 RepID=A0ABV3EPP2_9ACTN